MQLQETITNIFRISPQQKHLWHLQKENSSYCVQSAILIEGRLKKDILKLALEEVVNRQDILRTNFIKPAGIKTPMQGISEQGYLTIQEVDFSNIEEHKQLNQVASLLQQQRLIPWNFEQGSLLRVSLINLSANKYILLMTLPAICADSRSIQNLVQEISLCYDAALEDRELEIEEIVQYLQFSEWQNELLEDADADDGQKYWQKYDASSLERLSIPLENQLPNDDYKFDIASYTWQIQPNLLSKIKIIAEKHQSSVSDFLVSCWQILLSRFTEQKLLTIGIAADGRKYEELESVIGLMTKYLPLSVNLENNPSFHEVLETVSQSIEDNWEWQEYFSWDNWTKSENNSINSTFFPFSFDFQSETVKYTADEVSFSIYKQFACTDRFKIKLSCYQQADCLIANFDYDINLFQTENIQLLATYFQNLVESAVDAPATPINKLEILNESDRHQVLVEFNHTKTDFPQDKCFHQLFTEQVARTPQKLAVVFGDQKLTYTELNARCNQLAHYLQKLGVKAEALVGIYMERSLDTIVALLAILKAGGAYLPLDPALPEAALTYRLQDAGVSILLTQQSLITKTPDKIAQIICLDADSDWELINQENQEDFSTPVLPENLVYAIYTSGSTGKPKAVAIEHRQLVNYIYAIIDRLALPTGTSFAIVSTFAADLGNTVIFPSLCTGGCLHIIPQETASDPQALADYFQRYPIDCLKIVPSHLTALLTASSAASILPRSRLILGGEASSWQLIEQIQQIGNECQIFNHYGPTETTVGALTYPITKQTEQRSPNVPLGKPLANTQVYILDEQLQPVPIGVAGELYIGGAGLARGYLNQPELTDVKFIPNPFSNSPSQRLYKTGDLARYLPDGNITFIGRIDNQVKIRGFRIELGEIETVLNTHPQVKQAVVVLKDTPGNKILLGYIVKDSFLTIEKLREFLQQKLPDYMIPTAFVVLSTLPLTSNGKIDRKALPATDIEITREQEYIPPRTQIERKLTQIWSEILNLREVGVRDNFFTLGGHSLLAVRLMSLIQQQFHKNLPLATLFQSPTIEQLTLFLGSDASVWLWSPLVPIQQNGSLPPLFCVAGVGGNILYFHHLARHLGNNQPLYGLQAQGLDGETSPLQSIEEIAQQYIQAIQTVQSVGPYFLVGHSFGGRVVFEMATQLQRMGESIAYVGILDAAAPTYQLSLQNDFSDWDNPKWICHIAEVVEKILGENLFISKETLTSLTPEQQLNYFKQQLEMVGFLPPQTDIKLVRGLLQVFQTQCQINYLPTNTLNATLTLFRTQENNYDQENSSSQELAWDWNQFSDREVDIHIVPGNHISMMSEPHVKVLAEKLQKSLDKAKVK